MLLGYRSFKLVVIAVVHYIFLSIETELRTASVFLPSHYRKKKMPSVLVEFDVEEIELIRTTFRYNICFATECYDTSAVARTSVINNRLVM